MDTLNVQEVLQFTQEKRLQIIDETTKNGLPTDTKEIDMLSRVLDSMDKAVILKQKLIIDENNGTIQKHASKILTEVLRQFTPPKLDPNPTDMVIEVDICLDDNELVKDEMTIGTQKIEMSEII